MVHPRSSASDRVRTRSCSHAAACPGLHASTSCTWHNTAPVPVIIQARPNPHLGRVDGTVLPSMPMLPLVPTQPHNHVAAPRPAATTRAPIQPFVSSPASASVQQSTSISAPQQAVALQNLGPVRISPPARRNPNRRRAAGAALPLVPTQPDNGAHAPPVDPVPDVQATSAPASVRDEFIPPPDPKRRNRGTGRRQAQQVAADEEEAMNSEAREEEQHSMDAMAALAQADRQRAARDLANVFGRPGGNPNLNAPRPGNAAPNAPSPATVAPGFTTSTEEMAASVELERREHMALVAVLREQQQADSRREIHNRAMNASRLEDAFAFSAEQRRARR
jgi:hypothetical protein